MRRLLPPITVTAFALFAAQPLFVRQLTCSDDGFFHINKAVALEQLIRAGHWFGRWSPQMAHGFGYPYFNYYGPLASYVLIAVHNLGFIYPVAFHILLGLCIWLAGLAAYAFVREWWGEAAGVAAAVMYLTAPYLAFDILYRGALAETFALIWPPIILFTLHRALTAPSRRQAASYIILASLSFAALVYSHNATALAVAPLAAGYVGLLAFIHRDTQGARRVAARGGLTLVVGLALSARFWIPALAESSLVQTDRLLVPPIFTYYTNYLTARELFAPPAAIDPLLINPSPPKALGLIASALALLGFAAIAYRSLRSQSSSARRTASDAALDVSSSPHSDLVFGLWVCAALVGYSILTLPLSRAVWDNAPLAHFLQFPWRLLGPASLCAAVLGGAGVRWLPKHEWLLSGAIVAVAALGHLSWWYPRYCGEFQEVDLARTVQYEFDTYTLGTTAKGEFLPTTVRYVPEEDSVAQALIRGEQPNYLSGLPADANLSVVSPDPLNYRALITLSQPVRLTFNQFYFPGWRALVDNQPARMRLTPDTGLITVLVPAGRHELRVYFGSTPVRALSDVISILALIGLLAAARRLFREQAAAPQPLPRNPTAPHHYLPIVVALILIFARPLIIDRTTNPLRRSAFDGQTVRIGRPVNVSLSGGLDILSTEFPSAVPSGSDFDASLYLAARQRVTSDYRPRFDVVSPDGLIWNNGNDALPPRWHKEPPGTQYWPADAQGYAQWARRETLLPGTPPGDYSLTAVIFDHDTLAPDSVIDSEGRLTAPRVPLGVIHATRPPQPPSVNELNIQYRQAHDFGPLTLLGYNLDRAEARPGDSILITLFLRADESMPDVQLVFQPGQRMFDPSYPTSQWQPGDIWRFQTVMRIPAAAESGPFQFVLNLIDSPAPPFRLQPITLHAPERVFSPPIAISRPASIRFGNWIELAGYELDPAADSLTLTLLWKAIATPDADLLAFVHVADAADHIVAQSDAVPADWSRPTTSWLPGEYIVDRRTLPPLPSGGYTLYVGFADRVTGARLPTADGDRAVIGVYKVP